MYDKRYDTRNDVNMSFDDFTAELSIYVEKLLDGKAKVTLSTIEKVNDSPAKILTILYPGDNVSPAMNLELFYEEYRRGMNTRLQKLTLKFSGVKTTPESTQMP